MSVSGEGDTLAGGKPLHRVLSDMASHGVASNRAWMAAQAIFIAQSIETMQAMRKMAISCTFRTAIQLRPVGEGDGGGRLVLFFYLPLTTLSRRGRGNARASNE